MIGGRQQFGMIATVTLTMLYLIFQQVGGLILLMMDLDDSVLEPHKGGAITRLCEAPRSSNPSRLGLTP